MTTMQLDLVSPEKIILSKPVALVTLPGREGDFGVLAEHAPLITSLRPGVITVEFTDGVTERWFADGGFVDVTPTKTTVLADHALPVSALDAAALAKQKTDLEEDVRDAADEAERAKFTAQLAVVEAKLAAAGAVA